jgi:hypothetical protein
VLRDVPDNSTVVGVPGHIVFPHGKRVVITDPKQINDPLSEALAAVVTEVDKLASVSNSAALTANPASAAGAPVATILTEAWFLRPVIAESYEA